MTPIPPYSSSEKKIFLTTTTTAILSLLAMFVSTDTYAQTACFIVLTLSVSEILFITMYRDIVYNSDEQFNHKTIVIGTTKLFSIIAGCMTSVLIIFITAVSIIIIQTIIPVLWILILIFSVFALLVLINKKVVQRLYESPQK